MLFAGSCFWSGIRYLSKNSQETALSMGHTIFSIRWNYRLSRAKSNTVERVPGCENGFLKHLQGFNRFSKNYFFIMYFFINSFILLKFVSSIAYSYLLRAVRISLEHAVYFIAETVLKLTIVTRINFITDWHWRTPKSAKNIMPNLYREWKQKLTLNENKT